MPHPHGLKEGEHEGEPSRALSSLPMVLPARQRALEGLFRVLSAVVCPQSQTCRFRALFTFSECLLYNIFYILFILHLCSAARLEDFG